MEQATVKTWEDGVTHIHLKHFSIAIIVENNKVTCSVWEPNFEGAEPLNEIETTA